jgi:hypothetical protein
MMKTSKSNRKATAKQIQRFFPFDKLRVRMTTKTYKGKSNGSCNGNGDSNSKSDTSSEGKRKCGGSSASAGSGAE